MTSEDTLDDDLELIAQRSHAVAALFVGLHADAPRQTSARISLARLGCLHIGRGATGIDLHEVEGGAVLRLPDPRLSRSHARLTYMAGAWVLEDLQSKNGVRVGAVRIQQRELVDGDVILVGHTFLVFRSHGGERSTLLDMPSSVTPSLVTLSPSLRGQLAELAMAARSTTCVEIRGESGTGKELVARAVHDLSNRRGPFVAVNCGSLPPTLFEGELFGHRRGAYTGASEERPGLIRSSDGGTLFLDEVAELPAASQPALLRVLQEREVTPLGADRAVRVNLRVVTATHRDLDVEVVAGRFRADLRARLLGLQLDLPPLRERREDLGMIIASILERFAPRELTLSLEAAMAVYAYDWPLNVRELERVLVAAASVVHDRIEIGHLSSLLRKPHEPVAPPVDDGQLRERLASSIERHHGNLAAVARELCKDRTQVRRWMKRFGLARGSIPIRA